MSSPDENLAQVKLVESERAVGVKEFVGKVQDNLHELGLDDQANEELKGHIDTVHSTLDSEAPEHSIVDDALEAMHRLMESSSTRKATELLAEAGRFLTGVG